MTNDDMQKIDISVFDENDLQQHQEKMLIIFSCCVGFRGSNEHAGLLTSQIGSGTFPANHPTYPNQEWCGLLNFGNEKTHKLSFATSHTRESPEGLGQFPVLSVEESDDPAIRKKDAGGSIKRFLAKLPTSEHGRFYLRINKNRTAFLANQVLGKGKIRTYFQSGFKRMGLKNWKDQRPHSGRGYFISSLANDPSVPIGWGVMASRHKDPITFMGYATNGPTGGAHVLNAVLNAAGGGASESNKASVRMSEKEKEGCGSLEAKMAPGEEEQLRAEAREHDDDNSNKSNSSQTTVVLGDRFSTNEKKSSVPSTIACDENQSTRSIFSTSVASTNHIRAPSLAANHHDFSRFTQVQLEGLQSDMARFEASFSAPAPANHHEERKEIVTPAANEKISIHTQYQMNELSSDIARLAETEEGRSIITPATYAPSEYSSVSSQRQRPRFEEASLDSLRGFERRAYVQERRVPSKRELRLMRFRAQLNELERRERVRNLQELEYENMRRRESFPYWNSYDEFSTLYRDSVTNDIENEENQRRRRRRKNTEEKRPFY
jgi:hypothetical protein